MIRRVKADALGIGFTGEIRYRNAKGHNDDPDFRYLIFPSPLNHSFPLPIATLTPLDSDTQHLNTVLYILALGFVRGVWKDYENLESLEADDKIHIKVKDTFNDQSLFLKENGRELSRESASTDNLANYVKRLFVKVGLPRMLLPPFMPTNIS
jgi:hypothetical protein